MSHTHWIELAGADNVRDLAGLPAEHGREVQPHRLIRADSLQDLTAADVRLLVDDLQVRAVADLRTGIEVTNEGPGPMTREPLVNVQHLSLFPEVGHNTDAAADGGGPVLLPWQSRDPAADANEDERRRGASGIYLRYLEDRGDSIIDALRLVARTDGATIVHCAAGKDRTGTVVAIALAEVGVSREAIVVDYTLTADRIEAIFARLGARRTYSSDMSKRSAGADIDRHRPRAATMEQLLTAIDEIHGGVPAWLRAHGWTDEEGTALRRHLLG